MKKKKLRMACRAILTLLVAFLFACVVLGILSLDEVASKPHLDVVKPKMSAGISCRLLIDNHALDCSGYLEPSPSESEFDSIDSLPYLEPSQELVGEELYRSFVDEIGEVYFPEMDTAMVKGLIYAESRYQPSVVSSAGAVGLMQVIPYWHAYRMDKYGLSDIYDPYTNILVGMDLLDELYDRYGNLEDALCFYSGGSTSYFDLIMAYSEMYR